MCDLIPMFKLLSGGKRYVPSRKKKWALQIHLRKHPFTKIPILDTWKEKLIPLPRLAFDCCQPTYHRSVWNMRLPKKKMFQKQGVLSVPILLTWVLKESVGSDSSLYIAKGNNSCLKNKVFSQSSVFSRISIYFTGCLGVSWGNHGSTGHSVLILKSCL